MTESVQLSREPRQAEHERLLAPTGDADMLAEEGSDRLVDRLVKALDGTEVGVWEYDLPSGDIWFSDSMLAIQGYSREEALCLPDFHDRFVSASSSAPQYVHPDDLPLLADVRRRVLGEGVEITETEHRMLHKDGHWVWVVQRSRVVERDAEGAPTRLVGIRSDISKRRNAQEEAVQRQAELESTKRQLDLAMDAANLGIWTWDLSTRSGQVSESARAMCGISSGPELSLEVLSSFVHPADLHGLVRRFGDESVPAARIEQEFRAVMADGSVKWLYCAGARAADENRQRLLTGIILDISERKKAELQLSIAESELSEAQIRAFRYQVNPHFLFNTLSSIATLILDGKSLEAEEMVLRLASFYRSSLQRDPLQKISLREEIELQQLYLSIEKVRFPDEIDVHFAIEPGLEACFVPCLLLQPLIENSIKYGLRAAGSMMRLEVRAWSEEGQLCLQVMDDGRGSRAPMGTGSGLRITERRLAAAYADRYSFEAKPGRNGGFKVSIRLPMESDATPLGLKGEHEALLSIARRLQAIIRSPGPPPDSDLARIEEDLVRALAEARISLRRTSRGPRTTSKKTGEYTP